MNLSHNENLFELASKYAGLKGTAIIPGAYSERDDEITFVVEAGQKRTMTREELKKEITDLEEVGTAAPGTAPLPEAAPPPEEINKEKAPRASRRR